MRFARGLHTASILVGVSAAVVAFTTLLRTTDPLPLSLTQVSALLPSGSILRGLVRVNLDGRPPLEAAVVATIPQFPGAAARVDYGFIFAYDAWRRRFHRVYVEPLPGPVGLAIDAGRLLGAQDGVIFAALRDDGRRSYQIVGHVRGRIRVAHQGVTSGALRVIDAALVDDGPERRALVWDGRAFREHTPPPAVTPLPRVTWRFNARNGVVVASSSVVQLQPRQSVRIVQSGGGPTPIIIPDLRLDIVEQGYRARTPGTYTIRILLPGAADERGFTLRLVVQP